jgi:Uma2 family endonuclease
MAIQRPVLTYEDYAALPDDGRRYEIHDGELSVTPAPGTPHQQISGNLHVIFRAHLDAGMPGQVLYAPLDVILSNTTVVQPDLVYIDPGRAAIVSRRGIEGAPTLAVEIISPSTPRIDRVTKLQLYARYGVPYYWIVDPDARTIEAYELAGGAYRAVGALAGAAPVTLSPFPGLRLIPERIWPPA